MKPLPQTMRLLPPAAIAALLLAGPTRGSAQDAAPSLRTTPEPPVPAMGWPTVPVPDASLRAGDVLVLASWRCSYMQLARVNEVAQAIIEVPLTRAVDEGRLRGWGQFNGEFRDEFNYHTFYIAPSIETYRQVLGSVLRYMNDEAVDEMQEFYRLCDATRETAVTVVLARP